MKCFMYFFNVPVCQLTLLQQPLKTTLQHHIPHLPLQDLSFQHRQLPMEKHYNLSCEDETLLLQMPSIKAFLSLKYGTFWDLIC